jgi:succinate-acetate transporter protein
VVYAAVELGWIPATETKTAALAVLLATAPLQGLASIFGFLSRDPVAATGFGVLAGIWAVIGASSLAGAPGATSSGLGIVLLAASAALLVPVISAIIKPAAAAVMAFAAVRFAVTGIAELTDDHAWLVAAGIVGIALGVVALYAALAFELEGVHKKAILPIGRRGDAKTAMSGDSSSQIRHIQTEAGVREQL